MDFQILDQNGPVIFYPKKWQDERGYFMETFRQNDFESHCGFYNFVQDNQSKSTRGVLRGLHYQITHPQGKLVRVISGQVFDIAVDLRKSSANFGKVYSVNLDTSRNNIFWIPPGFAHGFLVLSDTAEFVYKCTDYYFPTDERCILWNDPELSIAWPLANTNINLSDKDKNGALFKKADYFA